MHHFSRRDFLKLAAAIPISAAIVPWLKNSAPPKLVSPATSSTNVIVILFDAMSARNLSVYGYPRDTTPNLARFAERATVYHSHDSAGNFTTPGTTSLLTGLYPWTHRAINLTGLMRRNLTGQNLFRLMKGRHQRLAFTENMFANYILSQFHADIDIHLSPASFDVANEIRGQWFKNDLSISQRTFDDFLFGSQGITTPASLLLGSAERLYFLRQLVQAQNTYSADYPVGLPESVYPIYYRLEEVFNGIFQSIKSLKTPTFAYFHLFPPHQPYRPSKEFFSLFFDSYQPLQKPLHPLEGNLPQKDLDGRRRRYDQYIADLDSQFGRLMDNLEQSGFLDNSVVMVTGDHGQLFERGVHGHTTALMYDPVLHVPLLISTPGQGSRNDIYAPTNSVDVLPTLLHMANQAIPEWCEGTLLPGLGGEYDLNRGTFSIEAKLNSAFAPLKTATIAMRKGPYKLIHYMGYKGQYADAYEMYNLEEDLEEMHDLYTSEPSIAGQLRSELLGALNKSNSQFEN